MLHYMRILESSENAFRITIGRNFLYQNNYEILLYNFFIFSLYSLLFVQRTHIHNKYIYSIPPSLHRGGSSVSGFSCTLLPRGLYAGREAGDDIIYIPRPVPGISPERHRGPGLSRPGVAQEHPQLPPPAPRAGDGGPPREPSLLPERRGGRGDGGGRRVRPARRRRPGRRRGVPPGRLGPLGDRGGHDGAGHLELAVGMVRPAALAGLGPVGTCGEHLRRRGGDVDVESLGCKIRAERRKSHESGEGNRLVQRRSGKQGRTHRTAARCTRSSAEGTGWGACPRPPWRTCPPATPPPPRRRGGRGAGRGAAPPRAGPGTAPPPPPTLRPWDPPGA